MLLSFYSKMPTTPTSSAVKVVKPKVNKRKAGSPELSTDVNEVGSCTPKVVNSKSAKAASSNNKASGKKSKGNNTNAAAKFTLVPSKVALGPQVQMLKNLAAVGCYIIITDETSTTVNDVRKKFKNYFSGTNEYDEVIEGQIFQLLKAEGIYQSLWLQSNPENIINPDISRVLSKLSNLKPSMVWFDTTNPESNLLDQSKYKPSEIGTKDYTSIDGRAIKRRNDNVLKQGKKAEAYWKFSLDGHGAYHSGKNEDDSLTFVLASMYMEEKGTVVDDDDGGSDDEDAEVENYNENEEGNEDSDITEVVVDFDADGVDDDQVPTILDVGLVQADANSIQEGSLPSSSKRPELKFFDIDPAPQSYQPDWLLTWMLLGPWGAAKFGLIAQTLFSAEAGNLDDTSRGGKRGRKKQRDDAHAVENDDRDTKSGRGISAFHEKQFAITEKELGQKDSMILLEERNLKLIEAKELRASILELMNIQEKIMDRLTAQNKVDVVDSHGINRYEIAETKYYELSDKLQDLL